MFCCKCLGVGVSYLSTWKIMLGMQCFLLLSSFALPDFRRSLFELWKIGREERWRGKKLCVTCHSSNAIILRSAFPNEENLGRGLLLRTVGEQTHKLQLGFHTVINVCQFLSKKKHYSSQGIQQYSWCIGLTYCDSLLSFKMCNRLNPDQQKAF